MEITFDIETLPCVDPQIIADIHSTIKPPANYKKADTIAQWWETEGEQAKADAVAKTSLDGAYGRIGCICWAIDDQPATGEIGGNEANVIRLFFDAVYDATGISTHDGIVERPCTFVGHNITGFDLRFLWQRAVVLGIKRPAFIPFNVKPWDERIRDTMVMWNPDRDKRISLDKLCKVLGVQSSKAGDLDGSKIAQAWADGRHAEIADYCRADVEVTRECYRRMAA